MAIKQYKESDRIFSFEESDILLPELADWYKRWNGVKMVDFIWKKSASKLLLIEVKSSSPNFISGDQQNKTDYIQILFEKFSAAIHATIGITLGCRNYIGFSSHPSIHTLETLKGKIHIVLVIIKAKSEWLPSISYGIKTSSLFTNLCKRAAIELSVVNPEIANKLMKMNINEK